MKISVTTQAEQLWDNVSIENPHRQKIVVKQLCKQRISDYWRDHIQNLVVQGKTLELIRLEANHSLWKSLIYNLPERVAKFMLNSLTDSLNNRVNLLRWGKMSNDKCSHCGNRETLHHVLNFCPLSLEQGRFTWRHNNVLRHIMQVAHDTLKDKDNCIIQCDLKDKETPRLKTTIPLECTVTDLIPDMCILKKNENKLLILELSVPFETNLDKAHAYKSNKYAPLVSDIEQNGFQVIYLPIEIGSRGFISNDNLNRLKRFLSFCDNPVTLKVFRNKLSSLAVISSFVIFHAKEEPSWECRNHLS